MAPPRIEHVPAVAPVPVPHDALSQSAPVWQIAALVVHVPWVPPLRGLTPVMPHVPPMPHCASEWQIVPALHVPV